MAEIKRMFIPTSANVFGHRAMVAYACPELDLCMALTKDGQIWKIDFGFNNWLRYEPDFLELALQGKAVEIEMFRKITEYWSGWQDSNLRSSAPKADGLPTFLHPDN
jgi:hypothetical protein